MYWNERNATARDAYLLFVVIDTSSYCV